MIYQIVPLSATALTDSEDTSFTHTESPQDSSVSKSEPAVPIQIVGEEQNLRTEDEKHFRMSDGSFLAVSYGMPVHYEDAEGNWQHIENTLQLIRNFKGESVYMKSLTINLINIRVIMTGSIT